MHTEDDSDRLVGAAEVALLYGIEPRTLADWRRRGVGPAPVKLTPRVIRYRLGDVRRWLAERREAA